MEECKRKNIPLPNKIKFVEVHELNLKSYANEELKILQQIALGKGGKCLSKNYLGAHIKLQFICKKGHKWKATPDKIKQGRWCPKCAIDKRAKQRRLPIEDIQKIALEKGGWCLSEEYINAHTKLWFQCGESHIWDATPDSVKTRHWCPYCSRNKKQTIEEMQQLAIDSGGKCLSEKYVNSLTKLKWQCEKGHIWDATPGHIKHGQWCPECYKLKRKRNITKFNRNYKKFPHKHKF